MCHPISFKERKMKLNKIERKVLGALLTMSNDEGLVEATLAEIAKAMGYKKSGGALSFAIRILESENYISKKDKRIYRVLL